MSVGLFLCRAKCIGSNVLDVDAIAGEYSNLESVRVFDNLHAAEAIRQMVSEVQAKSLDSVVLAACSPHFVRNTLGAERLVTALEEAGVNINRVAFANLKEQCALPHRDDPAGAQQKARLLVQVALERAQRAEPARTALVAPHRCILVLGGGPAGLIGAYRAAMLGYRVLLVERSGQIPAASVEAANLEPALNALKLEARVELLPNADVEEVYGWAGDYTVELTQDGQRRTVTVGGILVAVTHDSDWLPSLAPKLHIQVDAGGRVVTRNNSTMASWTREDGVFVVSTPETDLRAQSQAASAATGMLDVLLSQNEIRHPLQITEVDTAACGACGTCVKTCAFHANRIDPARGVSVIDERRCKACGNCVTACPAGARDQLSYPNSYLAKAVQVFGSATTNGLPKVLCMLCDESGYAAADRAGLDGFTYPASVFPLRLACAARVDTQYVLEAFGCGFDGVMVAICPENTCPHIVGDLDMKRRVNLFREVLRSRRLDPERVRIIEVAHDDGERFAREVVAFVEELKRARQEVRT